MDYFSKEISTSPADSNLGALQFNANHPILASTIAPLTKGAYEAAKFVPGFQDILSSPQINGKSFGPDLNKMIQNWNPINNFNPVAKTISDVSYGLGNAVPTIAMANPLVRGAGMLPLIGTAGRLGLRGITPTALGFGAFEGGKAGVEGRPIAPAAAQGAISGAEYATGGKIGSAIAGRIANPLAKAIGGDAGKTIEKISPRVGAGIGMAATGAMTAPPEQKISNAIVGGALALNPLNAITQQQYNDVLDTAAKGYQTVLNPGKNILNSQIDVSNAMKTLAKEGVVIKSDVNHKLDNSLAIQQLQEANRPHFDLLKKIVSSDPHKQFDLEEIRNDAKKQMEPYYKNAEDLRMAMGQVDSGIDAEIARHGQFVSPLQSMAIKQGMYERAFDPLHPTSNEGSRAIGSALKNAIEQAFPTSGVAEINSKIGDNLEAIRLLEKTNGGIVQRGKIGKYAAQLTGAMALDKIPIIGPLIGGTIGGGVSDYINSPERITTGLSNRLKNFNIINPDLPETKRLGVVTPEIVSPISASALPNMQPMNRLGFNPTPEYVQARHASGIPMPAPHGPTGLPINQPPVPSARAIPSPDKISQIPRGNEVIAIGKSYSPEGQFVDENAMGLGQPLRPSPNPRTNLGGESDPYGFLAESKSNMGKNFGLIGALGAGSIFNPLNANASQVKEPERLKLPPDQYTKKEEGFQSHPYIDTTGNKTIGYGFKMDAVGQYLPKLVQEGKRPLTREEADKVYTKLYAGARKSAQNFAGDSWHDLNGQQQKALTDMAYNMGGKLNGFKKLRQAIDNGDFHAASNEIMNSAYARQAKNRAARNAALIAMK